MTAIEPTTLGVVSRILTSFVLLLASQFVRQVLIPWYQQIVYDGDCYLWRRAI